MAVEIFDFIDIDNAGIRPAEMEFRIRANTRRSESPFTGAAQIVALPGTRWEAEVRFENLLKSEVRELFAFLTKLEGQSNLFYLWDHSVETPAGIALDALTNEGDLAVYNPGGSSNTGTKLWTYGWKNDQAYEGVFKPGDYVSYDVAVGSLTLKMLHMVVDGYAIDADADTINQSGGSDVVLGRVDTYLPSSGSGKAALRITPPIMLSPAEDVVITITKPRGTFRLASDEEARKRVRAIDDGSLSFSAYQFVWSDTIP